jgi:3D (Asp-Asp-Asp) domain-containing protein
MFCSLLFSSFLCLATQPTQTYDQTATFTAYNLTESQTDGNPCIGAGNHNLCELAEREIKICATRKYPLHTILCIKGIGKCEVLDRTSLKYKDRIDIVFPTYEEAIQFGKREMRYKVVK